VDTVLDLIFEGLLRNSEQVCAESRNPLERLKKLLGRHVQMIRENHAIPRLVFSEEVYNGNPQRQQRMFRGITEYLKKISNIIVDGQRKNHIRCDMDADTIAMMFLGLIQPAAILWHISDEQFEISRHSENAWKGFSRFLSQK
jgi:hypothetical protein